MEGSYCTWGCFCSLAWQTISRCVWYLFRVNLYHSHVYVIVYWSVMSSTFLFCISAFSWPYFGRTWWKTLTHQICRAVASLTVPGGQGSTFLIFSSNFDQFSLFFLRFYLFSSSFWLSGWASRPPGKALATPLQIWHELVHGGPRYGRMNI